MEQNGEPRNKSTHICSTDLQQAHSRESLVSSAIGVGKTGYPYAKEWNWTLTPYKNQLKMEYRLKCKAWNCKVPRKKHMGKLHDIGLHSVS